MSDADLRPGVGDADLRPGVGATGLAPSRLSLRDLVNEATTGVLGRPGRAALTALGTVLGIGALVTTVGLTSTASSQIVSRVDATAATQVVIRPAQDGGAFGEETTTSTIPWDAEERLVRLNGVLAAGTSAEVDVGTDLTRATALVDPLGKGLFPMAVTAASGGLFDAVHATVDTGRVFDAGHDARADPVAVLGRGAAERLGITRVDNQPVVFVGDRELVVIGILADVDRSPALLNAVIVSNGYARERLGLTAPAEVQVDVELGAGKLIGRQAPVALDPNQPDRLQALLPPDAAALRSGIAEDTSGLLLVLGAVSLLVGALGIANVTLVSVMERVGEIGLRRAVGGARRHIAAQFLLESTLLGALGGILGTSLGVLVIVGVSASREWSPVLDPLVVVAAPLVGTLVGLLAGLYPAWRAASMEPITALRQGTG